MARAFPYDKARAGDYEAIEDWVQGGGDINAAFAGEEWGPLHLACSEGNLALVRKLLQIGSNPNCEALASTVRPGHAPLHICARYGNSQLVEELIAVGANPNGKDNNGLTPLHYATAAAINGEGFPLSVIKALLRGGASPLVKSAEGIRAVDYARSSAGSGAGTGDRAQLILDLLQTGIGAEASRQQLRLWLTSLGCEEYLPAFVSKGYDDIAFIAAHGLTTEDMDCIGVPMQKLGLRRKLAALHGIKPFVDALQDKGGAAKDTTQTQDADEHSDEGSDNSRSDGESVSDANSAAETDSSKGGSRGSAAGDEDDD